MEKIAKLAYRKDEDVDVVALEPPFHGVDAVEVWHTREPDEHDEFFGYDMTVLTDVRDSLLKVTAFGHRSTEGILSMLGYTLI